MNDDDCDVPLGVKLSLGLMALFGVFMILWAVFGGCR